MKIHTYIIFALLAGVLLLVGCSDTQESTDSQGEETNDGEQETETESKTISHLKGET
ncbi:hypothetical protein LF817_15465 [Halobacillus sp. A1]|uniref:hypothetical protein n=1 Tax=Halobacillus sp. A1 TaxID=2880262 RepID=UPI0020A6757D|nr:hypothetical protein [Halobacillus sp. A1]MCP3032722.1 hypothetical protein [Halobacillus sp. A1]